MRVSRFYIHKSLGTAEEIRLDGPGAHYIRNVLRLKPGDPIIVFNGSGGEFAALVINVDRTSTMLRVGEFTAVNRQSQLSIELALALVKKDAMDIAIQKATELNVRKIQPLISSHTSVSTRGLGKKLNHWQQTCYSACEQCGLNIPPVVESVETFPDWVSSVTADLRLIANPAARAILPEPATIPQRIAIAVGPEGGFSAEEVTSALDNGFTPVNLGSRILRSETAAIVMLTLLQSRWGDLR